MGGPVEIDYTCAGAARRYTRGSEGQVPKGFY